MLQCRRSLWYNGKSIIYVDLKICMEISFNCWCNDARFLTSDDWSEACCHFFQKSLDIDFMTIVYSRSILTRNCTIFSCIMSYHWNASVLLDQLAVVSATICILENTNQAVHRKKVFFSFKCPLHITTNFFDRQEYFRFLFQFSECGCHITSDTSNIIY